MRKVLTHIICWPIILIGLAGQFGLLHAHFAPNNGRDILGRSTGIIPDAIGWLLFVIFGYSPVWPSNLLWVIVDWFAALFFMSIIYYAANAIARLYYPN